MSEKSKKPRAPVSVAHPKIPAFCIHARSGNAFAKHAGVQHWFGPAADPRARARYQQFVASLLATGSPPASEDGAPRSYTVADLVADYFERHAQHHYKHVADGKPTSTIATLRLVAKAMLSLFGELQARDFSLLELRALRQALIDQSLARKTVNDRVGHAQRIIGWAASEGLIPPENGVRLRALRPLQKHRSAAHECPPRQPVEWATVEATLPFLSRQLQAIVRTLWLTGARPSEIVQITTSKVDMSGPVWVFTVPKHKTLHHGKVREIDLGPAAQEVLRPFVQLDRDLPWFRPSDAERERNEKRRASRRSPRWPSHERNQAAKRARATRQVGDRYDTSSIGNAISRACEKAGVGHWSAYQLRHSALSRIRREFGIEAALSVGGHGSIDTTELYTSSARRQLARDVAAKLG